MAPSPWARERKRPEEQQTYFTHHFPISSPITKKSSSSVSATHRTTMRDRTKLRWKSNSNIFSLLFLLLSLCVSEKLCTDSLVVVWQTGRRGGRHWNNKIYFLSVVFRWLPSRRGMITQQRKKKLRGKLVFFYIFEERNVEFVMHRIASYRGGFVCTSIVRVQNYRYRNLSSAIDGR